MYKVLWIDDQYNDPAMQQFEIEAANNDFNLDGYPSFEEGFEALEKNLESYDVVLLDGLFFENKGQVVGTESEVGLGMAIAKINELRSQKVFPWFVLSGKDKFTKDDNSIIKANKAQCFDKTNPSDIKKLFIEMKDAAKNQPDYHLKLKYEELLKICEEKYIGKGQFLRIFSLIKDVSNIERIKNTEDMFNPIRKIIEALFSRLENLGVLPKEVTALNGKSYFLSTYKNKNQDKNNYIHNKEFIHPLVAENIHRLLIIIQDASHEKEDSILRVSEYLKDSNSDFLYRSSVYLLFDILSWFKDFIDTHDKIEENEKLWKKKDDRVNEEQGERKVIQIKTNKSLS